ncbi:MAG: right-handed parallel beta-helix repeat-containing protein [Verrucomicrobiales bacterium]|jgi:hypothetical protein|nr:right-handed parallel beta-helix repeat-containing protein [Verrucomicrobiales bacterium]
MQTSIINKISKLTLILTFIGTLGGSALNVFAASTDITENTTETGAFYDDSDTDSRAALNVTTGGVTYTGTNITINTTNGGPDTSPIGDGAYIINGAGLSLTNSTITTSGSRGHAVWLDTSGGTLNNVNMTTTGYGGYGVSATNASLLLTGGSIHTSASNAYGISLNFTSSGTVSNVNIQTEGRVAYGVRVGNSSTLTMADSSVTTSGSETYGFYINNAASGTLNNVNIEATGNSGGAVYAYSGTLVMTGGSISTNGTSGRGIYLRDASNITLNNVDVQVEGDLIHGISVNSHSALTLNNSNLRVTGNSGVYGLYVSGTSTVTVELNGNTLSNTNGNIISSTSDSTVTVTGSNGSIIAGNVGTSGIARIDITLTGAGTELHGNFSQGDVTNGVINLSIGAGVLLEGRGILDNLTLASGAIIGYADGVLTVTDSITIGDGITIDFSSLTETDNYLVLDWAGASITGGSISDGQFTIAGAGVEGTFSVQGTQLYFNATAVPEPSTWFLLGAGLGVLALIRCRRHRC